ncbi:MAG: GNAT family N-acetyltransferase [Candidatus Methanofastidiosia archaeon]|jgi:N-acetylglutamate synthase-like GNAT family acetyltransferase
MHTIHIKDATHENVYDLINLCIPKGAEDDPLFIKGIKEKEEYIHTVLDTYKTCAKVAYIQSNPVGLIQYIPVPEEKIVHIQCIFVPHEQNQKKGVGTNLLHSLLSDMKSPQPAFNNQLPTALVTYAFEVSGWFPQHIFYQHHGFIPAGNDPYLLYYPLQKGYHYTQKEVTPQKEDKGKALIFHDPSCPFSILFTEKTKESIKKVTKIPIRVINTFYDKEEVEKRGDVPQCIVNTIPIKSFVDDEEFESDIIQAVNTV